MKLSSPKVCAALGLLGLLLSSCGTPNGVDAVNPTISQMDKLDTQWGLPPRQSKGTPHKYVPSSAASNTTPPASNYIAPPAPEVQTPANQPATVPSSITVDPSVIQKLR